MTHSSYDDRPMHIQTPQERAVHLLDVENLLGGSVFTTDDVRELVFRVGEVASVEVASVEVGDAFIVASSHRCAPATWFGCPPSARRLVRSGLNGADPALNQVLVSEGVAARFARVVIGSGDGFFAEEAARLQAAGCHVTVLTRRDALSRKLRLAVRDVRFIDEPVNDPVVNTLAAMVA